ncbi:putative RNA-directed DNA polymerase, eukaryota, reverse transcriptase zinc-binding domain protein [Tanacetum coccineum]
MTLTVIGLDWIENPSMVKAEFLGHFSSRFQQPNGIPPSLDSEFLNPISPSKREFLERPFSRGEIKKAVWDCGGDRAPGPDGFTFKFFTTFWDLIEDDVIRFVHEYFRTNLFPKGCNSSFIALIPKYRLSIVISDCVNPVQSAFIKGRNILDGPLILNEVLAWHRQRKKELMVFKVDFEKAFDSLRWDFLDLILDKLGFGSTWGAWIRGCLYNARSSVLVNGSPTEEFVIHRGLRQRDPMSHFLFILAMEGLHALTCKAEALGLFKGVTIGRDNLSISHLMYADDAIFFGDWSWINAQNLISMLRCFFLISGLQINIHKSSALGVGVHEAEVTHMANIIGCGAAKFPLKYLGVPVGCNMARCLNWNVPFLLKFFLPRKLVFVESSAISLGGSSLLIRIGGDPVEKKLTWIKWDKCLASKRGINSDTNTSLKRSTWGSILSSINSLKSKGIDLFSYCTRKIGNGLRASGLIYGAVRYFSLVISATLAVVSEGRFGFFCAFFRDGDLETVNHNDIFNCGLAKELWSLLAKLWDLDIPMCGNIAEWHAWLGDLHVSSKVRLAIEEVGGTLLWSI